MSVVSVSPTDQGPPPPPPPIYVERTRGSKIIVQPNLHITVDYDREVAPRCSEQGAVLWLRSPSGSWYNGLVDPRTFADDGSGYVTVAVNGLLDPMKILIQPRQDPWAQTVDLG